MIMVQAHWVSDAWLLVHMTGHAKHWWERLFTEG